MVMHVLMILVNLQLDVDILNTVAMIIMSVLMIIVIRLLDAITLRLSVTMEMPVLMIIVILTLVAITLHILLVTIKTHVPMIIVAKKLDFVFTILTIVMIIMLVPRTPVVLPLDVHILKLLAKITMLVLKILVIKL
jgi:hypothetical protein